MSYNIESKFLILKGANFVMMRNYRYGSNTGIMQKNFNEKFFLNIEQITCQNDDFMKNVKTLGNLQIAVMSNNENESTGIQFYNGDSILKIEKGIGKIFIGKGKGRMMFNKIVKSGGMILIPVGMCYSILNIGKSCIKLFAVMHKL